MHGQRRPARDLKHSGWPCESIFLRFLLLPASGAATDWPVRSSVQRLADTSPLFQAPACVTCSRTGRWILRPTDRGFCLNRGAAKKKNLRCGTIWDHEISSCMEASIRVGHNFEWIARILVKSTVKTKMVRREVVAQSTRVKPIEN
jgi:hypothetical protein